MASHHFTPRCVLCREAAHERRGDVLESIGDHDRKKQLGQALPYWLRHTFAKAALMHGEDMHSVATWLGIVTSVPR